MSSRMTVTLHIISGSLSGDIQQLEYAIPPAAALLLLYSVESTH